MTGRLLRPGHNGGPPLDPSVPHERGRCKNCIHWLARPENEQRAYEMFRVGLSCKRVKRPTGTCDQVLFAGPSSTVFSATTAEFSCRNFEAKPRADRPVGGGFVTIWSNGRVVWQGPEEKSRRASSKRISTWVIGRRGSRPGRGHDRSAATEGAPLVG